MIKFFLKRGFFILFFIFFACSSAREGGTDTFFGEIPTGLVELADFRYPVYLYVPKNYKPERTYPLVMAIPGEGETAEEHVKTWSGFATRKSLIILVPSLVPRETDVPFTVDKWFIDLKNNIAGRYRVPPEKIYLVGRGKGAHYASYLAVQYPEEFSAAALLGGAWTGPYEKLMQLKSRPVKQVPFFVALREGSGDLIAQTESKAYQFAKKGYPVYFEKAKSEDEFSSLEFRKRLFAWLEEKGANWREVVRKSQKTRGEKIRAGMEEFVQGP